MSYQCENLDANQACDLQEDMMNVVVALFGPFLGFAALSVGAFQLFRWLVNRDKPGRALLMVLLGIFSGAAALATPHLFVEQAEYMHEEPGTPRIGRVIVFDDNGRVKQVSKKWAVCTSNCANAAQRGTVTMSVTPITENPKVRRITYDAEFEVTDWQAFFRIVGVKPTSDRWTVPHLEENLTALKNTVRYWLYEFNDAHSRELARFYNPLDGRQREELERLMKGYLNQRRGPTERGLREQGIRMRRLVAFRVE